jgi:glucosamine--fructose-6-phosphate aminotransferase (isomerizing)
VNVVGSLIATTVDCGVYMNAGREVAVPATKSFSNQVVILCLITIWFSYHRENLKLEKLRQG